jgi:C4-dicarboxylate-specific signal transduction histidine kinase
VTHAGKHQDDGDWNTNDAIFDRAARIKRLLKALKPFAENSETEADRIEARKCMEEIKEWL